MVVLTELSKDFRVQIRVYIETWTQKVGRVYSGSGREMQSPLTDTSSSQPTPAPARTMF